jgi:hypothetical protein
MSKDHWVLSKTSCAIELTSRKGKASGDALQVQKYDLSPGVDPAASPLPGSSSMKSCVQSPHLVAVLPGRTASLAESEVFQFFLYSSFSLYVTLADLCYSSTEPFNV